MKEYNELLDENQSLRQQLAEAQNSESHWKYLAQMGEHNCGALTIERDELRAELAKNQAAREWISVEDSLPPDKHNVLVRHDGGHEFGHITSIAHRFYGGWFPPYREDVIIKVSHWRELPEPPPELRALIQPEEKK